MKSWRHIYRSGFVTTLGLVSLLAATACSQRDKYSESLAELVPSVQAYSRDRTNQGQALPESIPLEELIRSGYASTNLAGVFEDIEVRLWLRVNEGDHQKVLVSARQPDGIVIAALADGSVQQFSSDASFAAHLEKAGQSAAGN